MSEDQGNVGFSLSRAAGGDDRRDPVPVHLCGGSLQTLPITQSVLGGVFTVVGHAAAHHEPPEPLLSAPAERLRDPIACRRDAEHHTHMRKRNVIETPAGSPSEILREKENSSTSPVNNTLYGSKLYIFHVWQKSLGY